MNKMNIMKRIDILDLIKINVFRPNLYDLSEIEISLESLDKNKKVVVDEESLKTLNQVLVDKCKDFKVDDPNLHGYLEEFVGRMCSEWYKLDLLILEDYKDAPEDPYEKVKRMFGNGRN